MPRHQSTKWAASVVLLMALTVYSTECVPLTLGRGGAGASHPHGLRAGGGLAAGGAGSSHLSAASAGGGLRDTGGAAADGGGGGDRGSGSGSGGGMWAACSAAAEGLLGRMSLEDQASQLSNESPALPHLGLPAFNWWTECLHGFYTSGPDGAPPATHFPMPLALAASFNTDLVRRVYSAIGEEAQAHNAAQVSAGRPPSALNCFTPNINLLRDPRWGRASEVYGEDPHLTSRMAVAAVRGLQGEHAFAVKVGATCKHFAAHSLEVAGGVTRHTWDAVVDDRDLRESYLPAFRACVVEGRAHSVMCAYNKVNGVPACAHPHLLRATLNDSWGFGSDPANFVVSDCGAVSDLALTHGWNSSLAEAAAEALTAGGLSLFCDNAAAAAVPQAVASGLLAPAVLRAAVRRMLLARCRLGILGAAQPNTTNTTDSSSSSTQLDTSEAPAGAGSSTSGTSGGTGSTSADGTLSPAEAAVDRSGNSGSGSGPAVAQARARSHAHTRLAYAAALRSITLLVNRPPPGGSGRPLLPLQLPPPPPAPANTTDNTTAGPGPLLALLGPHADGALYYLGTYYGTPSHPVVTPLAALREALGPAAVSHTPCLTGVGLEPSDGLHTCTQAAAAAQVAAVVFVGGSSRNFACGDQQCTTITPVSESEGLDRGSLRLPGLQEELVRAVARSGVPVVVVAVAGGPLDLSPLLGLQGVAAVLAAPYGGQQAGYALASVLLGTSSPSGRLPATWLYDWYTHLSDPTSMAMRAWPGRTYRYLQVPVLFPFGFGLSYTHFHTTDMRASPWDCRTRDDTGAGTAVEGRRRRQAAPRGAGGGGGEEELCFRVEVDVVNAGRRASGHAVLLSLRRSPQPPGAAPAAGGTRTGAGGGSGSGGGGARSDSGDAGGGGASGGAGGRVLAAAGVGGVAAAAASGGEPGAGRAHSGCRPCAEVLQQQQPWRAQRQQEQGQRDGPQDGEEESEEEEEDGEFAEWGGERYGHPDTLAAHTAAYHRIMADRLERPQGQQRPQAQQGQQGRGARGGSGARGSASAAGADFHSGGGGGDEGDGEVDGVDDDPPPVRELVAFGRLEDVSPGEVRTLVLEVRLPAAGLEVEAEAEEQEQEQQEEEQQEEEQQAGRQGGAPRRRAHRRYVAHLQAGALCCPLPLPAASRR